MSFRRRYMACIGALLLVGAGLLPACLAAAQGTVQVASELTTKNCRASESHLASVLTDAVRAVEKSDIALLPASAFVQTTLPKGSASAEDVLKALEFRGDTVVLVKLKGEQVKRALEHGLALYPQKNPAFLHVSGLSVTIDPSADRGRRVLSIKVGSSPLQDGKTYTVAMSAPLADGALAYFNIWSKSDVDRDTGKTLEDAVKEHLARVKTIGDKNEERLSFKK